MERIIESDRSQARCVNVRFGWELNKLVGSLEYNLKEAPLLLSPVNNINDNSKWGILPVV